MGEVIQPFAVSGGRGYGKSAAAASASAVPFIYPNKAYRDKRRAAIEDQQRKTRERIDSIVAAGDVEFPTGGPDVGEGGLSVSAAAEERFWVAWALKTHPMKQALAAGMAEGLYGAQ